MCLCEHRLFLKCMYVCMHICSVPQPLLSARHCRPILLLKYTRAVAAALWRADSLPSPATSAAGPRWEETMRYCSRGCKPIAAAAAVVVSCSILLTSFCSCSIDTRLLLHTLCTSSNKDYYTYYTYYTTTNLPAILRNFFFCSLEIVGQK